MISVDIAKEFQNVKDSFLGSSVILDVEMV